MEPKSWLSYIYIHHKLLLYTELCPLYFISVASLLLPIMGSSPKHICFFFILGLFFMQTFARESQFFSKVSPTTTTTTINSKEAAGIPNTEEESFNRQEQDPNFMPENQTGYGLYGQESTQTQFPSTTKVGNAPYRVHTTTDTYSPYTTQTQETYTNYPTSTSTNPDTHYYNDNQNSDNTFAEEQQDLGETSLQESSSSSNNVPMTNQNNNYYYNGANGYNKEGQQGMSDTRYMENGKYYYNVKGENNYFPNQYQNSRNVNYNNGGYYNNNNVENSYENSMQSFQNQENFQERQDEQYVPWSSSVFFFFWVCDQKMEYWRKWWGWLNYLN